MWPKNGNATSITSGMEEAKAASLAQLTPAMQRVKNAIAESITPEDLKAIMAKQIEKARGGDVRAAAFVLSVANKMTETKDISVVQNNYYESSANRPDKPITARTRPERAEMMRRRLEAGEPLMRPDDAGGADDPIDLS